jgi:MFS family permease
VVGAAIWAFAFFPLLETKSFPLIALATVIALVTHAAMYGPQAAFIAELFSTRLRYSGASMGYQVAGIVGGALAPIIALKLFDVYGTTLAVSIYVVVALAITAVGLAIAPETRDRDLTADSGQVPQQA